MWTYTLKCIHPRLWWMYLSLSFAHTYRVVEIVGEEEVSCRLVPLTLAVEPRGQQLRAVMIGTSLNWRHSKRSLTMTTHRVGTIILCDHQCIRIAWWRGWYIRRIMYTVSAITSLINSKYMIACDRLVCTLEKNGSKVCEAISIGVFCQKPPYVPKPHVWKAGYEVCLGHLCRPMWVHLWPEHEWVVSAHNSGRLLTWYEQWHWEVKHHTLYTS